MRCGRQLSNAARCVAERGTGAPGRVWVDFRGGSRERTMPVPVRERSREACNGRALRRARALSRTPPPPPSRPAPPVTAAVAAHRLCTPELQHPGSRAQVRPCSLNQPLAPIRRTKPGPANTDPAKTDPANTDPAKTGPAKTGPAKAGQADFARHTQRGSCEAAPQDASPQPRLVRGP